MKKLSSMAFGLNAMTALIVVGGGLTPAQASWQIAAINPTDLSVTVAQAHAYKPRIGAGVNHEDQPGATPAVFNGAVQRSFEWVGNTTPANTVDATLYVDANCPLLITVNPLTDGNGSAYAIFGINGALYSYYVSADWFGVVTYGTSPNVSNIPVTATFPVNYDPLTMKYTVNTSFDLSVSTTADVLTNRRNVNGQSVNTFVVDAKAGSADVQTNFVAMP
ncbi:hypothetical protein EON83_09740 [bacterium]|nr:MAG: hypothetical protein EON83_09740 [bacterium]